MASITINVPDSLVPRVRAAYSAYLNKPSATVADVKADLVDRLRSVVRDYEVRVAEGSFRAQKIAEVESEFTGVD